ncbi:unnamed protein product [Owenia fusiformis]|uniref:ODAD1 central coiled coil region domain-containing protein n=1 Tax=Owenia fusiformis TaxID=6347 RepID=A0A8S4P9K4_OWEFU|nr:unnamed protein product [Owenia fusiformis]
MLTIRTNMKESIVQNGAREKYLTKLKQQFRILEGGRKAYKQEIQNVLRKQSSEILTLETKQKELHISLRNTRSPGLKAKDKENMKKLTGLIKTKEKYMKQIEKEKRRKERQNEQIRILEKQVRIASEKNLDSSDHHEHVSKRRQIETLENKISNMTSRFNQQLTKNTESRNQIDQFRGEQRVFEKHYKKLDMELMKTKQEVREITEKIAAIYEQGDEVLNKMATLRESRMKEEAQFENEKKYLNRIIINDKMINNFMEIKLKERNEYKDEESLKRAMIHKEMSKESDQQLLSDYEKVLDRIKEVTKKDAVDAIVESFINNEDENFGLVHLINELDCEIESIQGELLSIVEEINDFKSQRKDTELKKTEEYVDLDALLSKAIVNDKDLVQQLKHNGEILDEVAGGVSKMFLRLASDAKTSEDDMGDKDGVHSSNILKYFGIIEHMVDEFLDKSNIKSKPPYQSDTHEAMKQLGTQQATSYVKAPLPESDLACSLEVGERDTNHDRPLTIKDLYFACTVQYVGVQK